jgi:hypothetical protein
MSENPKQLGYLGIDQYGDKYHIKKSPRKELLEFFDRQHANKMYCDTKSGKVKHKGYIIAGRWIDVYRIMEWKPAS